MTFPVEFHVAGRAIPAHAVFEMLAYATGFQLYLLLRRRRRGGAPVQVPFEQTMWILVGCVFGALIGSKLLAWVESPREYFNADNPLALLGGKTIVGGLLGGWVGVEILKRRVGVRQSTGDGFVFPLIIGIAIGRVGCFLTGLADHTHGVHTSLPWAVDFGDGPRHPTQLYEIALLIVLGIALAIHSRRPRPNGEIFRLFMLGYLLFRFAVEFIKPRFTGYAGLSAIQWACVFGVVAAGFGLLRLRLNKPIDAPLVEQVLAREASHG